MNNDVLHTAIHLVGGCNDDPFLQAYFGHIWVSPNDGSPKILLRYGILKVDVPLIRSCGRYEFDAWDNNQGLSLYKDPKGLWRFQTGLYPVFSGSSGTLFNGGPELEALYNILFPEKPGDVDENQIRSI